MSSKTYATKAMADLSVKQRYFLMTACILPRPIALVTSVDARSGVLNAAPFSYFNGVCSEPPLIVLGLAARPGEHGMVLKDTARNIVETGEFVVNACTADMPEIVTATGEELPPEIGEVEKLGLATLPSQLVRPPRLAISPIHFECRLYQAQQLGKFRTTLILGEVLLVHVDEAVMENDRVSAEKVRPLARLGAGTYGELGRVFKEPARK